MLWLRQISYNRKLVYLIMGITGVTLVLSGVAFVIADTVLFRAYGQRDMEALAQIVAANIASSIAINDENAAVRTLGALNARPYLAQACLYRRNSEVFARYSRNAEELECPRSAGGPLIQADTSDVRLFRTVTQDGGTVGYLYMDYRIGEALSERRNLIVQVAAGIVLLAILVALILTFKLRLFLSRPLLELVDVSKTVSQTHDYSIRAVRRSTDEVGALADAFNDVLAGIQRRDTELMTARQDLESRVAVRTAELQESERRFRLLVGEVRDYAIFMLDPAGYITSWNEGAQRIKGYRADEAIGLHISRFYPPEELSQRTVDARLQEAAAQGRSEQEGWRVRKDGSRFWANAIITALHDPQGRLIGFSKITRDLTERKAADEALREQAAELTRSNTDLQQFAAVASHDLQEPLRMVTNFMQLVSERCSGKLDAETNEFIGYAVDGATRMRQLINDLLAYSRVSAIPQEFALTSCENVLLDVLWNLAPVMEEHNAAVTCDTLPEVLADRAQIAQLFQNLIANAIKFSGPDPPAIHLSAVRADKEWIFSVRDNGIGIRREHYDRIFVMFKRLHDRTQYPGTGIGLAICKRIVEKHRGRIWVESESGRGSTFLFTLPAVTAAPKEAHFDYSHFRTSR
jgi:PAS domain S-box-containing protein